GEPWNESVEGVSDVLRRREGSVRCRSPADEVLDNRVDECADHAITGRNLGGEATSDPDRTLERPPERVAEQLFNLSEGQLLGKEMGEITVEGAGDRARWGDDLGRHFVEGC